MKKYIVLLFFIISLIILSYKYIKGNEYKDIMDSKNNMIAIYVKRPGGGYEEASFDTWPGTGYVYNEDRSGCIDSSGNEITLEYDSVSRKALINTTKSISCYLFFDIDN